MTEIEIPNILTLKLSDGTVATWELTDVGADLIGQVIEDLIGIPDTLKC